MCHPDTGLHVLFSAMIPLAVRLNPSPVTAIELHTSTNGLLKFSASFALRRDRASNGQLLQGGDRWNARRHQIQLFVKSMPRSLYIPLGIAFFSPSDCTAVRSFTLDANGNHPDILRLFTEILTRFPALERLVVQTEGVATARMAAIKRDVKRRAKSQQQPGTQSIIFLPNLEDLGLDFIENPPLELQTSLREALRAWKASGRVLKRLSTNCRNQRTVDWVDFAVSVDVMGPLPVGAHGVAEDAYDDERLRPPVGSSG